MIREITQDTSILTQQSQKASVDTMRPIVQDLMDTANAHMDNCMGLAAIQIGIPTKIIVVRVGPERFIPMMNPAILHRSSSKIIRLEGCLSIPGEREVKRPSVITVMYRDRNWKVVKATYSGLTACAIQHEIDHLHGVLI